MLVGGLLTVVATCIRSVDGGILGILNYAFSNQRGFNLTEVGSDFFSFNPHVRVTLWLVMFSSSVSYLAYNTSDQISIQQLLGTRSYKQARKSFITSLITFVPFGAILWFLGLSVFTYFGQNPLAEGNPKGDTALFKFISMKMPTPMPGLMAAAMIAAAISTIGACLTSFATVATKDFYLRFFKPSATEMQQIRFSRVMVIVIGMIAAVLGLGIYYSSSALKETVLESSAIWIAISAVVAPTFLIGMLNKRCNTIHALSAIVV